MEITVSQEKLIWIVIGSTATIIFLALCIIILFKIYRKKIVVELEKTKQLELDFKNQLVNALIKNKDRERKRIASVLHDEIGSKIAISTMLLNRYAELGLLDIRKDELLFNSFNSCLESTRKISHKMNPPELEDEGISDAMKKLLENFEITGLQTDIYIKPINSNYRNKEVDTSIYRILYELIQNTLKHSKANKLELYLSFKKGKFYFIYKDNGIGFNEEIISNSGLGLYNIKSRCEFLKAEYKIKTSANEGFKFSMSSMY